MSDILFKTPLKNFKKFKSFLYYKINGNNSYKYIGTKHWIYNYFVENSNFRKTYLEDMNEDQSIFSSIKSYDIKQTLPNYYLSANDFGSMRSSLEMRSPFLNKKLLSLVTNLMKSFISKMEKSFYKRTNKRIFAT